MFEKHNDEGYQLALEGIERKTLVYGGLTLMTEFVMGGNSALPMHQHPYEQTGYLVKGHLRMTIGGSEYEV